MFQNFFIALFLCVTVLFPLSQCKTSSEQQACLQKTGRWEVGACDQCMTTDQCGVYEGTAMFCCPYMKKCVPSSSHGCSSQHGPYGSCRPTCFDYEFPFDCPGCTAAFPEEWPGYECYAGTAVTDPPTKAPITVGTEAPTVSGDPCHMVNCGTFGICAVSMKNIGVCICKGGWSGLNCEIPPAATCSDSIKNGNEVQADCGGSECPACENPNWVEGNWVTICEPQCVMSRDVTCVNKDGNTQDDKVCEDYGLHPVKRTMNCSETEKAVACVSPVNVPNPNDYKWMFCGWDECTATCGGLVGMIGMQHRLVFCTDLTGKVVSPAMCPAESRPETILVGCGQTQCDDFNWMADSAWSSCLNGARSRSFHCHGEDGTNQPDSYCQNVPLPEATQECEIDTCPPPTPSTMGLGNSGHKCLHISWVIIAMLASLLCLL